MKTRDAGKNVGLRGRGVGVCVGEVGGSVSVVSQM